MLQKMSNGKFMSKKYSVPIADLFKTFGDNAMTGRHSNAIHIEESESSEDEIQQLGGHVIPASTDQLPARGDQLPGEDVAESEADKPNDEEQAGNHEGRPKRSCGAPRRLIDEMHWDKQR